MTHPETPARPRRPREETARLGREIYELRIRPQVEPGAVDILFERVGYPTLYSFGGGALRSAE